MQKYTYQFKYICLQYSPLHLILKYNDTSWQYVRNYEIKEKVFLNLTLFSFILIVLLKPATWVFELHKAIWVYISKAT